MAMKDFDFKSFMLQKGERVGLWTCVGLGAAFLILSLFMPGKGFFSGSPSANAGDIKNKSKDKQQLILNARPNPDIGIVPEEFKKIAEVKPEPPEAYRPTGDLFQPVPPDRSKRGMPRILTPTEFRAVVAFGQIRIYKIEKREKGLQIAVLKGLGNADKSTMAGQGGAFGSMGFGPRG